MKRPRALRARRAVPSKRPRLLASLATAGFLLAAHAEPVDDASSPHLSGDVGVGAHVVQGSAPGARTKTHAVPYVYADFGRLFVREDTFGAKLTPLGWGWLELAGRVSSEGADGDGPRFAHRTDPRPIGLGSFQETPWGGLFLNAFVDTVSGGALLEATYVAQATFGPVTVYPSLGIVHRGARYVDHLHGVSAGEAAATGVRAYAPGASTVAVPGVAAEWALGRDWAIVGQAQRERFDGAIARSPRVDRAGRTSLLLAFTRRFD